MHDSARRSPPDRLQISAGNKAQNLPQTAVVKCLISEVVSSNLGALRHSWTSPKHKKSISVWCQHGCVFLTCMSVSLNLDVAFKPLYMNKSKHQIIKIHSKNLVICTI